MHFERAFDLPLSPADVWKVLWDVERMVGCVPGCTDAKAVEEGRSYAATIVEKVGPFKVVVPLDIQVVSAEPARTLKLRATGKDTKVGTEVAFDLDVMLEPFGAETQFRMTVDATVVGRLVSLGQAVIKMKGDQQIGKFAQALRADLVGGPGAAAARSVETTRGT
jgi:carbon monoxide dehydrogenase subunit G